MKCSTTDYVTLTYFEKNVNKTFETANKIAEFDMGFYHECPDCLKSIKSFLCGVLSDLKW